MYNLIKNGCWYLIPLVLIAPSGIVNYPSHQRLLDRKSAISPLVRNIHDAYSHGCNGSTLFDRIERGSSVALSPPRWSSSLCRSAGRLVRMVHAPAGGQRPRSTPTISRDHGRTTDQTQAVPPLVPSSFGVTTLARSSATKTVSGSCRAVMMAMPFGHAQGR